jgi:hypothetical protein
VRACARVCVRALQEIPATDEAFWRLFATAVVTADDVFAVVSPRDIRSAITKAPRNMHTLVVQVRAPLCA